MKNCSRVLAQMAVEEFEGVLGVEKTPSNAPCWRMLYGLALRRISEAAEKTVACWAQSEIDA